jgi:hypothetical protein
MGLKLSNNASSTLAGAITAVATSFNVAATEGARFPALGAGDWCMATLVKIVAGNEEREIVKVTARTNDSFTVVRGQEGTTGTTFSAGDRIELRLTAGSLTGEFDRIVTEAAAHTDTEVTRLDGEVDRLDGRIDALGGAEVTLAAVHAAMLSF